MSVTGTLKGELKALLTANSAELSAVKGNLLSAAAGSTLKTVVVTSCYPLEGKTVSAISMAYALVTTAHAKVLLIDANIHSPKLHELFEISSTPGLSDFLLFNHVTNEVLRETELEGLAVMTCGMNVPNKTAVFDSGIFRAKLDTLKDIYDYIILDSAHLTGSSEYIHLLRSFDAVILTVECEKTKWEVLQEAKEKISNAGGKVLGVVLNKRKYHIPQRLYGKI